MAEWFESIVWTVLGSVFLLFVAGCFGLMLFDVAMRVIRYHFPKR